MKLFKRRRWEVVVTEFMTANMANGFGMKSEIEIKIVLRVKERRNGTYKYDCYGVKAISNEFVQQIDLDYILSIYKEPAGKWKAAVRKYKLRPLQ
jgi:hypothetical protein